MLYKSMPSKSRSVHLAFFVSILLTMSSAHGQGVLSISTDKSEYAHGEPIEIHIVISNPTTETFTLHGSSSCQVWFRFDDFDAAEHSICTLDALEIQYPPGTERNYYFTVDPAVLGLPGLRRDSQCRRLLGRDVRFDNRLSASV